MAELIVQKYGGSSVATPELIRNVAKRVIRLKQQGHDVVIVVSAMGKTTDNLVALAKEVCDLPKTGAEAREMDMLLTAGERISMALLAMAIHSMRVDAISLTGSQSEIITDTIHTDAKIVDIRGRRIREELEKGKIVIVAGFQGVSLQKEVTTLGRGGSDTTAVALAVALKASRCDILTDVAGVYTADPRIVSEAHKLKHISYDEMLELAFLGAKVLHPRCVELARKFQLPIQVGTSFTDEAGTTVSGEGTMENVVVRGIAHKTDIVKISVVGIPDIPGQAARIFRVLGSQRINTILITQAQGHNKANDIAFVIPQKDKEMALLLLANDGWKNVIVDETMGMVSVVGEGIGSSPEIAGNMFTILADQKINIDLISSSNITITCVVPKQDIGRAVSELHKHLIEMNMVK